MDIKASCSRDFTAVHHSGARAGAPIWVVLHSTEGDTARGAAEWFTNPASGGSAQLVVDDRDCFRTLADTLVAWGAPGANEHGLHLEQAGFAHWTDQEWRRHDLTLRRAAFKTAVWCKRYAIPVRLVVALGLKRGLKGVTTHAECTKAFGGDHTDPGAGWPRALFLSYVRAYRKEIG